MKQLPKWLVLCAVLALGAVTLPATASADPGANKQLVQEYFRGLIMRDKSILSRVVREDLIQHVPTIETGLAGLFKMLDARTTPPPKTMPDVGIVRMVAEGDMVIAHIRRANASGVTAVVDVFRIQDGQIAEHWSVAEPVPPAEQAVNQNGFF